MRPLAAADRAHDVRRVDLDAGSGSLYAVFLKFAMQHAKPTVEGLIRHVVIRGGTSRVGCRGEW